MAKPKPLTQKQRERIERLQTDPDTCRYMEAGSACSIPEGDKGLWYVQKMYINWPVFFPIGTYTILSRWTDSTIHQSDGETVMVDQPIELSKHLQAAMRSHGTVLVTGLGLACVLRMLQVNQQVEQITVIEKSQDVIDLVWPHTSHDRVELVHADALEYLEKTDRTWDTSWHDLWCDEDRGEPKLQVLHQELILATHDKVHRHLGAWAFPRHHRRAVERILTEQT